MNEKKNNILSTIYGPIFGLCLLTAIAQAVGFLSLEHFTKVLIIGLSYVVFAVAVLSFFYLKKMNTDNGVRFIIIGGTLLRCGYILMSGLYERQHDAGAFTGMGTDFVNPGHIGYIEYIYKFGKLPQINPYELFGYYHPPFHHIIETIWLKLNILLGVSEELAFENLQIPTLIYSCLLMVVAYRILKVLKVNDNGMIVGMLFIALHPSTIVMGGSVNNDMLTILFMALIILITLEFIRNKTLNHLILLALCIGFGMITKLNAGVLALPVGIIFLMHFIEVVKTKDRSEIICWVKNYVVFAIIVMPIGLSWIIRNEVKYSEHPGVPVPGPTSPLYTETYSLWERLGIPSLSQWHFDFPFHPLRASACCNTWAIMFHTAMFAEEYPVDMNDALLFLSQVTFILSLVLALVAVGILIKVMLDKRTDREDRIFVLVGYITMIISFIAFVIIYPYTCSSDFRYITICLFYTLIAIGMANKYSYKWIKIFNDALILCMGMTTLIYFMWDRW
ncbi:MAG: glycosyltransferase family 39 protein [Lachnospiraceae bacterium]|nr:glycosyltransferase family 39 protein [Lachnospiraceae bacterium]